MLETRWEREDDGPPPTPTKKYQSSFNIAFNRWRSVAEVMMKHGTTWKEMTKAANNRVCWRSVVLALGSTLREED